MGIPKAALRGRARAAKPVMLLIPGFGDDAGMFEPLRATPLARSYRLVPVTLPGFGAPALTGSTTLARLAEAVHEAARRAGARIAIAHSAASIIASLAAARPERQIDTVLALEGNLTADDAYFSGTAADYPTPGEFRAAFLARLDALAREAPAVARYRAAVARADAAALWQLGVDVRRFSSQQPPGELLMRTPRAAYFYNPDNISESSREWLERSGLTRVPLDDATHWKCYDQPGPMARKILETLGLMA